MVDAHTTNTESEGAVTRLLEREPPEGYRAEWTRHVAEQKTVNTAELRSCMVFRIGTSFLAVPTNVVEVVAEDSAFHTIPQRRSGIARVAGRTARYRNIGRSEPVERPKSSPASDRMQKAA